MLFTRENVVGLISISSVPPPYPFAAEKCTVEDIKNSSLGKGPGDDTAGGLD